MQHTYERGQLITYKYHDGCTYQGLVEDITSTMLGVKRGLRGEITYDAVNITHVLCVDVTLPSAAYRVGDRVRLITEDAQYGNGGVRVGDVGTVTSVGGPNSEYDQDDLVIDFERDNDWLGHISDIEPAVPVAPQIVTHKKAITPDISLDEAVTKCQALRKQIADLQAEAKTYEQVMLRHNIRFV